VHRGTSLRLVGANLVVVTHEAVNLTLELVDARGFWLFAQPLLQGLVVALDLPLRLGVVGLSVLKRDPERRQVDLESGV
jgi:hypothetical protein